ncbi:MAG: hypothetical protein QNK40_08600 [Desulfobacterales bacterium]|nr:hypothetical protein [Desulfobacterales bacterium]
MNTEKLEMGIFIGAIIIVSLIFLYMLDKFFYLDMTKLGWKRARKNFPNVAAKLGLEHFSPKLKIKIGEIKGEFNGYQIRIRPDYRAIIEVTQIGSLRFRSSRLMLSTSKSQIISPPEGVRQFDSGNSKFDTFFQTRYALPDLAKLLTDDASKLVCLEQFRKTWKNKLRLVEVGDSGIRCSLKYGLSTYIPAETLEKILPDLCELAKIFQSLLDAGNSENTNRV